MLRNITLFRQRLVLDAGSSLTCHIFVKQRPYTRNETIRHFVRAQITHDHTANGVTLNSLNVSTSYLGLAGGKIRKRVYY